MWLLDKQNGIEYSAIRDGSTGLLEANNIQKQHSANAWKESEHKGHYRCVRKLGCIGARGSIFLACVVSLSSWFECLWKGGWKSNNW
jgi:hypothetical protein